MPEFSTVNETLMRALLSAMVFLETGDDEIVDPDAALKVLEYIHYLLDSLDEPDRRALLDFIAREAEGEREGSYRDFLLRFPRAYGFEPDVE